MMTRAERIAAHESVVCAGCGDIFYPKNRRGRWPKYCSGICGKHKYRETHYEQERECGRKYRGTHPGRVKEARRKYYETHREQVNESGRKYREENPEKEKERQRKWWEANPEKGREQGRKKRARLAGVESEEMTLEYIAKRDGERCQLCGKKVNMKLKWPDLMCATCDHIIPLAQGGANVRSNVHLAHWGCNLSKGTKAMGEQLLCIG